MSRVGPSRSDRPMRGSHLGFLSSHSVALAAGSIPAATMPLSHPALPRVASKKIRTAYRKESRPVAKRPADERKPFGFPLIKKRKGRGSTEPRRVTDLRND